MVDRSRVQETSAAETSCVLAVVRRLILASAAAFAVSFLFHYGQLEWRSRRVEIDRPYGDLPPLAMTGGDPYIRALMRTISASESNVADPYSVIYGGEYADHLDAHPDLCVTIFAGPNTGDCSTAAGRYQMLTTTWQEMAHRYHPGPDGFLFWHSYSFQPEYQDAVVYGWLSDRDAWGVDISALLREGQLDQVLWLLSGTWTSLGYGIEDNMMTDSLPEIYEQMLAEELQ